MEKIQKVKIILLLVFVCVLLQSSYMNFNFWIFEDKAVMSSNDNILASLTEIVFYVEENGSGFNWEFVSKIVKYNCVPVTNEIVIYCYFIYDKTVNYIPIKIKVNCKENKIRVHEKGYIKYPFKNLNKVRMSMEKVLWRRCNTI